VAAKNRNIPAFAAVCYGMPGFGFGVQEIQVVDRSWVFPVGLHTGDTAIFAAIAFFLIDYYALHITHP
jgi:hypothetical protein